MRKREEKRDAEFTFLATPLADDASAMARAVVWRQALRDANDCRLQRTTSEWHGCRCEKLSRALADDCCISQHCDRRSLTIARQFFLNVYESRIGQKRTTKRKDVRVLLFIVVFLCIFTVRGSDDDSIVLSIVTKCFFLFFCFSATTITRKPLHLA